MLSRMNQRLVRWSSTAAGSSIRGKLETLIPKKKEQLARIKKELGDKVGSKLPRNSASVPLVRPSVA